MFRITPIGKAAIISVLMVLVAGVSVFALVVGFHAVHCLNAVLGSRNGVSSADAAAHINDARAFKMLLHSLVVPGATTGQKTRAYNAFVAEHDGYVRVLVADQRYRLAHPLGEC